MIAEDVVWDNEDQMLNDEEKEKESKKMERLKQDTRL